MIFVDWLFYIVISAIPVFLGIVIRRLVKNGSGIKWPSWIKLIAGNILVLLFLLSIVFFTGETYYRFFYDKSDSFGLTRAYRRWFERHYQFNQIGPRDNIEYDPVRRENKRRITFIGDSFTVGHGIRNVEDRFVNLIRKKSQDKWEIHALALNGADTGLECQLLFSTDQAGYQFDIIVLVLCLNDISDIMPQWQDILRNLYKDRDEENFFVHYSYLINTLYYRLKISNNPDLSHYYGFIKEGYDSGIWKEQQQRLLSIKEFCQTRNVQLMVVTFPFIHALNDNYEFKSVHEKIERFWAENGVPHLDLLDVYKDCKPEKLMVNKYDVHPNEFAHKMAADAIYSFIEKNIKEK